MISETISQLMLRLAPKINATIYIEPIFRKYGIIIFQNGKRIFFKGNRININTSSTVAVTKNKFETSSFLSHFGYRVPVGKTFSKHSYDVKNNRGLDDGLQFIKEIGGFPVILKPNNKSQGILVCKVNNENEYYKIANKILKSKDDILLIEKFYNNYSDYRIVVLGDKIISAYQRVPLTIIGDGQLTILQLLEKKQKEFANDGRSVKEINLNDFRLKANLNEQGKTLRYMPLINEKIVLLNNANLSCGGTTIELTDKIADEFKDLAVSVAKDMNLVLCGIDILTPNIERWSNDYVLLEINSAPGLDNYAYTGNRQKNSVDNLYLQILKYIESH